MIGTNKSKKGVLIMDFKEKRGMGYCGLACVLCSAEDCPGCKHNIAAGGDCAAGKCAAEKNLDGCYACAEYESCGEGMPHGKRSRAFNRYAREYGENALIERLRANFDDGITYHTPDKSPGDYDRLETEEEIYRLLRYGCETELDIRRLSPELVDDYLYFFDNVAFADHPDWSQCYCLAFHFEPTWDAEDSELENPWRERAVQFVREGKVQGYLAYSESKVVGWCNTNDKKNYAALKVNVKPELWEESEDKKVKSVVCFLVAPAMRGKGIATKLLERVCADAEADGYDFIEAYPPSGKCDMYAAHHGTVALFEKCGFAIHKQLNNDCVMRKYLRNR